MKYSFWFTLIAKLFLKWEKIAKSYRINEMCKNLSFCGENVVLKDDVSLINPNKISIGSNTHIGERVYLRGGGKLVIGEWCQVANNAIVVASGHKIDGGKYYNNVEYKDVIIENNVWVGAGAIILPGVKVGSNSVVAAGAVVTKNVLANTVVAGVPAKEIKIVPQKKC